MNVNTILFFLLGTLLCVHACNCGKGKDIPDVSAIAAKAEIKRFEQAFFTLDTNKLAETLPVLEAEYGEFATLYFSQVLGSKDPKVAPEGHVEYVKGFLAHTSVRHLYDTTMMVFPKTDELEEEFTEAFRFFKYYFTAQPLSGEVVTYVSEYTIGGFLYGENSIAIGLDFYLGADYPYAVYNPANPNFSQYLTRTFNRDHIVVKSMKMLVQDMLGAPHGNRMLDHMLHNGKELYILDKLLPYAPDSVRLEYSQAQVNWCDENETNIWAYFLSENMLYSTEFNKYRKWVEYSPNSPGMPDEVPGRTANWLGWQIIKAYMARNPEISLEELLLLDDSQAILDGSKYKPQR